MKIKNKIVLGAIGAVLAVGGVLTTSVPAQAVNMSSVQHCNWPGKATFDLVNDSSVSTYYWKAYNPNGYYLGSYYGRTWYTPWEDVTVFVSSGDTYYQIVRWCR